MDRAVGLANTFLPLALLAGLAIVLPWLLVPRSETRVAGVTRMSALAGGIIVIAAALLHLGLNALGGADVKGALWASPRIALAAATAFALKSTLAWLPVLVFVWVYLATRANKRASDDAMREGRE